MGKFEKKLDKFEAYEPGWYYGEGEPLQPEVRKIITEFFDWFSKRYKNEWELFLTPDGGVLFSMFATDTVTIELFVESYDINLLIDDDTVSEVLYDEYELTMEQVKSKVQEVLGD